MSAVPGDLVRYTGCTPDQLTYGNGDDPREYLDFGRFYSIESVRVYAWYTHYRLIEIPAKAFNSVCFEKVERMSGDTLG